MQRTLEFSPLPPLPADAMSASQRRASLGMLIALAAAINVAFNHAGPSFASSQTFDWSQAMFGGLFAQTSLLAVWAGWRQQPINSRGPQALGLAALLGLATAWGATRQSMSGAGEFGITALVILVFIIQALFLLLVRRRWRWRIVVSNDRLGITPPRFALRQLLLWTAAAAVLLGLTRYIERPQEMSLEEAAEMSASIAITAPIVALLLLPHVIPGAWLALADRKRICAAGWLAVMIVVTTTVLFSIVTVTTSDMAGSLSDAAMEAMSVVVPLQVGLVTTLFLGLTVIRCCGFRLYREGGKEGADEDGNTAIPAAPGFQNQPRWRSLRFAVTVVGMAAIVALLVRPAMRVEQARRENIRRAAADIEWRKLGVTTGVDGEEIVSAQFDVGQPVSEQALARLCSPPHAATIRRLNFTGASITDDQLERLAALKNLESLVLDRTQITDAGLLRLRGLSRLKVLNLAHTRVTDDGLQAIQAMSSLQELSLNRTNVSDAGLAHVQSLDQLIALSLADASVTNDGLRQLQDLPKLEILLLDNTKISDAGLAHLNELKSLKVVTLQGAQVSPEAATECYLTRFPLSGAFNAAAVSSATDIGGAVR